MGDLPIETDVVGWENIESAPKDRVLLGSETDRPGINYFMMWWGPTKAWELMKPNREGVAFVLDQSRDWKPEPDYFMPLSRQRFTGWKGDGAISHEDVKPGDIIKVKVGGIEYDTVIDPSGVQRFIEDRGHWLVKQIPKIWDSYLKRDIDDMNVMVRRYHRREFSQRDYAEMNMAVGYSVDGFCDLSYFRDMNVENPLWG